MQLTIEKPVLNLFPALTIGVITGEILEDCSEVMLKIERWRREALSRLQKLAPDIDHLMQHPHIIAWRSAYGAFGVKAKTYKPTHEAFARRLLKGAEWPNINPLVDIYLTNQVAHLLPHGGFDVAALVGDLRLTVSEAGEPFEPLGGGLEYTQAGEVVYRDDQRVVTRRFNFRDAEATKIDYGTKKVVLLIESPSNEIPWETIENAVRELVDRYNCCYRGTFQYQLLRPNPDSNCFEL
jgi:DNA/RNA-binding domain of Phe-tRNA-synthetase-like protein